MGLKTRFTYREPGNVYSLLINLVFMTVCLRGIREVLHLELPPELKHAGHKQFLTNISAVATIAVQSLSIICHLTGSWTLFRLKNYLHSVATSLEFVVSVIYWPLRLFFTHMILSKESFIPLSTDLSIHLVPVVSLLLDFYFFMPNWTVTTPQAFFITAALDLLYWKWLDYVMDDSSKFPYPFLNVPEKERMVIFGAVILIVFGSFLAQKRLHSKVCPLTDGAIGIKKSN
ncbi:BA75_01127T0 [Komagataella pastoris]|uniref:BA75_01127T0 n=1 Tax=Komagataella pastoris TaxID=4922 RepID=A0A1B2J5A8_PICPA|nr:BA75_01127T0 [Komagataella pastoris]